MKVISLTMLSMETVPTSGLTAQSTKEIGNKESVLAMGNATTPMAALTKVNSSIILSMEEESSFTKTLASMSETGSTTSKTEKVSSHGQTKQNLREVGPREKAVQEL